MKCKICKNQSKKKFDTVILKKHKIAYYFCTNCGFLQTSEPYWLKEAYAETINISDTGLISRNLRLCKISSVLIYFLFNKEAKFVDFAGGYGIFTRLMRDVGFNFFWHDPYTVNLVSRGFEITDNKNVVLLTSFEAFEHFVEPIAEIENMLGMSENILFTTELLPHPVPNPKQWWYYGLDHGQHVSFYSLQTLKYIAKKYDLELHSSSGIHLLSSKKVNNLFYKSLIKGSSFGLFSYVKVNMKSKTVTDMYQLIKQGK